MCLACILRYMSLNHVMALGPGRNLTCGNRMHSCILCPQLFFKGMIDRSDEFLMPITWCWFISLPHKVVILKLYVLMFHLA